MKAPAASVLPSRRSLPPRPSRRAPAALLLLLAAALVAAAPVAAQSYGFSAVAPLNTTAASDTASDNSPSVATDGAGNWVAVWVSNDTLGGTIGSDFDVLFARSTDDGATWSAPAALNSNAATDAGSDQEPEVATDGAGNWVVVWYSPDTLGGTIGSDNDILFARSSDDGATWSATAALNSHAATDSGSDAFPRLMTDGAGTWIATWNSSDDLGGTIGTDTDVLFARSTDAGATWSAAAPLNTTAASDTGLDGGCSIATDGAGNFVAVWYSTEDLGGTIGTDADILFARSTDAGATWSAAAPLNSNAATDSSPDAEPIVATDGAGNWVVFWYSSDDLGGTIGTDLDVLFSRSTDAGMTWVAVGVANSNAATDTGNDAAVTLVADGAGDWLAAWHSNDTLGGTIGTDNDILFATSNGLPVELSGLALE